MDLADIMATTFASVSPEMSIAEAARHMIEIDTGAAVGARGRRALIGRDLRARPAARFLSSRRQPRGDGRRPHDAPRHDGVGRRPALPEAMALMVDGHFRHLPIVRPRPRHRHDLDARPDGLGVAAAAARRLPGRRRRRGHRRAASRRRPIGVAQRFRTKASSSSRTTCGSTVRSLTSTTPRFTLRDVFEHWDRFYIQAYVPRGSLGGQDYVLLRRRLPRFRSGLPG